MPGVCKFYVQGYCKFGDNCRFEHPGGGGQSVTFRDSFGQSSNSNQNPFRWTSSDFQKQQGQKQTTIQVSPNDVINNLIHEIQEWEQNKMWPFSCIAFEKDGPCVPDFDDKSPEELRMEAYEAIQSGTIPNYQFQVQKLVTDYSNKRQMLKNPGMQLKQKLLSLIEDYRIKKNSRSGSSFGNAGVSLFSSSGGSGTSPFSSGGQQSGNIFGSSQSGKSPSSTDQNIFGSSGTFGTSQTGTSSPFGTAQTGTSSPFGTAQTGTSSPFGTAQTGTSGPFGTAQTGTSSAFGTAQGSGTTPFGTGQTSSPVGLFGKPATGSAFGTSPVTSSSPFGTAQTSSFGSTQTGAFGTSSPFSSTPVAGSSSPFGNTSSGFGSANQTGAFGGSTSSSAPSVNLFGSSGQNLFSSGGGTEGGASPMSKSGQSFGAFGASPASTAPSVGLFGKPAQPPKSQSSAASSVYTPIDSLTPEELAAFQAPTFTLGKIPMKPPPRELCF